MIPEATRRDEGKRPMSNWQDLPGMWEHADFEGGSDHDTPSGHQSLVVHTVPFGPKFGWINISDPATGEEIDIHPDAILAALAEAGVLEVEPSVPYAGYEPHRGLGTHTRYISPWKEAK